MKTYIGTKIIEAVPAIRKGCKVYEKDQPIAMGMVPDEEGYKVCYPDGYESFQPQGRVRGGVPPHRQYELRAGYRGHEEGEEVQTGGLERKEPAH